MQALITLLFKDSFSRHPAKTRIETKMMKYLIDFNFHLGAFLCQTNQPESQKETLGTDLGLARLSGVFASGLLNAVSLRRIVTITSKYQEDIC